MIQHENTLVHQRLTWLFTLQGLLFGATSFIWKISPLLVIIISFVGLISCISIGYSLGRGDKAIRNLLTIAREYKKKLPKEMNFPPTIGSRRAAIMWLLPGRLLPFILVIAWILIIIIVVIHGPLAHP
jgi:hypothetical protein